MRNEIQNMSHVVRAVLDEDFDAATAELSARKDELEDIKNYLQELDDLDGDGCDDDGETPEECAAR